MAIKDFLQYRLLTLHGFACRDLTDWCDVVLEAWSLHQADETTLGCFRSVARGVYLALGNSNRAERAWPGWAGAFDLACRQRLAGSLEPYGTGRSVSSIGALAPFAAR